MRVGGWLWPLRLVMLTRRWRRPFSLQANGTEHGAISECRVSARAAYQRFGGILKVNLMCCTRSGPPQRCRWQRLRLGKNLPALVVVWLVLAEHSGGNGGIFFYTYHRL